MARRQARSGAGAGQYAAQEGRLAASPDVWDEFPPAHGGVRMSVGTALVQAQMRRAARTPPGSEDDRVEHLGHQPRVVPVGAGDQHRQGHAAAIREGVAFHPERRAIRRVRPRGAPPLGALARARSRDAKSHVMARRLP